MKFVITKEIEAPKMSTAEKRRMKKLNDYIVESNKAFEKKTMAEKRVALAEDVLFQLKIKRLDAQQSTGYFSFVNDELETMVEDLKENPDLEFQTVLQQTPSCTVCGIGSLFVVAVDRLNTCKMSEAVEEYGSRPDRDEMVAYFKKLRIFTPHQLDLIERAFEHNNVCGNGEDSLKAVMNCIIKAEGVVNEKTFKSMFQEYDEAV